MRGFIVLCLSAVALAAPQGYNYNPGATGGATGYGGGSIGGGSIGGGSFGSSSSGSTGFGGGSFSSAPSVSSSFGHGGSAGGSVYQGASGYANQGPTHVEPIVTKRFFIHSAPEDNDDDYKERHITVGVPKKNYNVVFIKAPSKSSKKTTLKITPAVNEEKTVVYVLTKKGGAHELQTEVLEQPQPQTKPEVFFIKYNTNEEAQHAQEQIQSQYDSLGGSSQVTDEGYAPVSSVIGSLGQAAAGSAAGHGGAVGGGHSGSVGGGAPIATGSASGNRGTGNAYLPPNFH